MPYDDRIIEQGINAGIAYHIRGGRLHGSDVAPAVRHVGHKMAQVGKYAQLAHTGYRLGKSILNSFSQKEKMPPTSYRSSSSSRSNPYATPKRTPKNILNMRNRIKKATGKLLKWNKPRKTRVMGARFASLGKPVLKGRKKLPRSAYFERYGTAINYEAAVISDTTTGQTALLTHSNYAGLHVVRSCVGTILKKLFAKRNTQIESWNDIMNGLIDPNDQIQLTFVRSTGFLQETDIYTIVAGDVTGTFDGLVTKIYDRLVAICGLNTNIATTSFALIQIAYQPATTGFAETQLSLAGCMVSLYLKAELKIQNRSLTVEANNEADDVDNVPLVGMAYDGKGTGFTFKQSRNVVGTVNAGGVISRQVGLSNGIRYDTGTLSNGLLEPWANRQQILGAKRSQKIKMAPGEIRSSWLTDEVKVPLDYVIKSHFQLANTSSPGSYEGFPKCNIGSCRLFILERVISLAAFTGVKLAYEHNGYVASILHAPPRKSTMPHFVVY